MSQLKKLSWSVILVLIPICPPEYIVNQLSLMGLFNIYILLQSVSIIYGIGLFLKNTKLDLFKSCALPSILCYIIVCYSTYVNGGNVMRSLLYLLQVFSLASIVISYRNQNKMLLLVNSAYLYLTTLVIANLFTMVLFPSDFSLWLLGNKNNLIYTLLPYLFLTVYRSNLLCKKAMPSFMFAYVTSLITLLIGRSSTSLFSLITIILSIWVLWMLKRWVKTFRPIWFFVISIILSIIFIFSINTEYLSYIIGYLDKEDTFGRFSIWEMALYDIIQNPLHGMGLEYIDDMYDKFKFSQCHNKYLDMAYIGGVLGLSFYILSIYQSLKNKIATSNIDAVLQISIICAYAVEYLMEGKRNEMAFFAIIVLYQIISKAHYENKI